MNPELDLKVTEAQAKTGALIEEMSKLLIGQKHVADSLVMGLLVGWSCSFEGLPGLAKTTSVKALSRIIEPSCEENSVYTRPFAGRCYRYSNIRPERSEF